MSTDNVMSAGMEQCPWIINDRCAETDVISLQIFDSSYMYIDIDEDVYIYLMLGAVSRLWLADFTFKFKFGISVYNWYKPYVI